MESTERKRVFRNMPQHQHCLVELRMTLIDLKRFRLDRWIKAVKSRSDLLGSRIPLDDIEAIYKDGSDIWGPDEHEDFQRLIAERSGT